VPKPAPRCGCFNVRAESVLNPTNPGYDLLGNQIRNGTFLEGTDSDGVPSYRVTARALHFTVKLRGNSAQDFFSAMVPPGSPLAAAQTTVGPSNVDARYQNPADPMTYNSQWAEIHYHLVANGSYAGTTALYGLYRAQFVVVANNTQLSNIPNTAMGDYSEFSCTANLATGMLYFNTPDDFGAGKTGELTGLARQGALLMDDVLSFEIVPWTREDPVNWFYYSYTSTSPGIPMVQYQPAWTAPMDGIRITLRVWDQKSQQARQITLYQDL
jgi:hypothetical protein